MSLRADRFTTITIEGGILPPDLLRRVVGGDKDLGGLTPDAYALVGEKLNEAIARSWNRARALWAPFRDATDRLPAVDDGARLTRDRWLLPLFKELDYGLLQAAKPVTIEEKTYTISHEWQDHLPIHLVGFRQDLDRRSPTTARSKSGTAMSPHGLVQEFVNRSKAHLWAFVSNGFQFRILRDNVALTRQSFVEFDLEAMLRDEVYPDFVVFWMLCHASRVRAERPEECWLESWSKAAQALGTRVREELRGGVERAIRALGAGFLGHEANRPLCDALESGTFSREAYYRHLLRLVYRLIFLLVAEDRDLLFPTSAPLASRERYQRFYSVQRLRRLATTVKGTPHSDLWQSLLLVMEQLGRDEGCPDLALPALGSFLWSPQALGPLGSSQIDNRNLLDGIRELTFTLEGKIRRFVDYRNLGAEELGSIYESLLELHPEVNVREHLFELRTATGNERKTTGSYYTPAGLVSCLLDSALDPVLDEAVTKPDPERAILDLNVVDPACGSGHFLIAAAHRIAKRLAVVRTGDDEPSPAEIRHAIRDVIGHCIHGVDINEMAVELCKVSLWMEALEPGKPLSFLDSKIRVGNALMGATPALIAGDIPDDAFQAIEGDDKRVVSALRKRNKAERTGQSDLFVGGQLRPAFAAVSACSTRIEELPDDSIADIHAKERAYAECEHSAEFERARLVADTWCAAFVWRKTSPDAITTDTLRKVSASPGALPASMRSEVERLREHYRFFHWHLAFPEVFWAPDAADTVGGQGWLGGFDVVLGNPPWERVKLQEKEWFASRRPDIVAASKASERKAMIGLLATEDPGLYAAFLEARRQAEAESHFIRSSMRYPLCGKGDVNTYTVFAELDRELVRGRGCVGAILPGGVVTDDTTKEFFQALVDSQGLASYFGFAEIREFFPGTDSRNPFGLLTWGGADRRHPQTDLAFGLRDVAELADSDRHVVLRTDDFALVNPNTRTCPIFQRRREAEITLRVHRNVPVMVRETEPSSNPWQVEFTTLFHMANDSGLFRDRSQLEEDGWMLEGNAFVRGERRLPLYEAKMVHHFDHRFGTYDGQTQAQANQGILPRPSEAQKDDPSFQVLPWFWVPDAEVGEALGDWSRGWLLGWRETCRNTDERTVISSFIPRVAVGHKFLLCLPGTSAPLAACLGAMMASIIFDFLSRQKVGGTSFTYFTMRQLPVVPPSRFESGLAWLGQQPASDWFGPRVLELTFVDHEMSPFARDLGYDGPPFHWDQARRAQIRAELDAAFFLLYGIDRSDAEYVLGTFTLVRKTEEAKFGEFRTKKLVLECHDAMVAAQAAGTAYRTPLEPPPGDRRAAHREADTTSRPTVEQGKSVISLPSAIRSSPPVSAPCGDDLKQPVAPILPFTQIERPSPSDRYRTCVPLVSVKIAAGDFGPLQERAIEAWVVPASGRQIAKGMFVAAVVGRSMEPDIHDGSYALFQSPWLMPRAGDIGIFALTEDADPETGAHFTLKKYSPAIIPADDGERQLGGTLDPLNPAFRPIPIREGVRPWARCIEILAARKPTRT